MTVTKLQGVTRSLLVVLWLLCITGSARALAYAVHQGWIDAGILTLSIVLTVAYMLVGWMAGKKGWL